MQEIADLGVRHIRVVLTVSRLRSISEAARELAVSQSQASRLLAEAERIIGTRLFRRTPRGIEVTDAGREAVDNLADLPRQIETATDRIRRAAKGDVGVVRIGYSSIAFGRAMPHLLEQIATHLPDLRPHLVRDRGGPLLSMLAKGDLDLALLHPPEPSPGLQVLRLWNEAVTFVVPSERFAEADLSDVLCNLPLMVPPKGQWPALYGRLLDLLNTLSIRATFEEMPLDSFDALALVSQGFGATILPASMARIGWPGVRFMAPESAPGLEVPVAVATASRPRKAVRRVLGLMPFQAD